MYVNLFSLSFCCVYTEISRERNVKINDKDTRDEQQKASFAIQPRSVYTENRSPSKFTFFECLKGFQWQPLPPNVSKAQQKAFVVFVVVVLNVFMSEHGKDELRWKSSPQQFGDVPHEI